MNKPTPISGVTQEAGAGIYNAFMQWILVNTGRIPKELDNDVLWEVYRAIQSACEAYAAQQTAALRTENERLQTVLKLVQQDYTHAWPDEDYGTRCHRTATYNRIFAALNPPTPQ